MNNAHRPTLDQLIDQADGGFKALLAAEIVQKTNRQHGPVDGRCEVCGDEAESFILQDWKRWHCQPCAMAAVRSEFEATMAVAA